MDKGAGGLLRSFGELGVRVARLVVRTTRDASPCPLAYVRDLRAAGKPDLAVRS